MNNTLEYYEKNAAALTEKYERADLKVLHEELKNFMPSGSLLEIGCGSGRDAAALTAGGFNVCGLDGSAGLLEEAARLHPELAGKLINFRMPGLMPFESSRFSGFYSIACLMHFNQQELVAILHELARVIVVGGRGFVSVPICRGDIDNKGIDEHGRVFTLMPVKDWRKLFEKCGFSVEIGSEQPDGLGRDGISWISFYLTKDKR